uniref:Uncharacterized protein n=1 Tax=Anguilla anguilla TaxID=7936 RepID=A0A0E9XCS0_ANGAN
MSYISLKRCTPSPALIFNASLPSSTDYLAQALF